MSDRPHHAPNTGELTISGLTISQWKAVADIAGQTCEANGGSKKKPCDECLEGAEDFIRLMKTSRLLG